MRLICVGLAVLVQHLAPCDRGIVFDFYDLLAALMGLTVGSLDLNAELFVASLNHVSVVVVLFQLWLVFDGGRERRLDGGDLLILPKCLLVLHLRPLRHAVALFHIVVVDSVWGDNDFRL